MIRLLLKLWPALLPILIYFFWVFVVEKFFKKKTDIEGEKVVGEGSTEARRPKPFSLQNRNFVAVLYASLILAILMLIKFGVTK